jgi:hypothetical protein
VAQGTRPRPKSFSEKEKGQRYESSAGKCGTPPEQGQVVVRKEMKESVAECPETDAAYGESEEPIRRMARVFHIDQHRENEIG